MKPRGFDPEFDYEIASQILRSGRHLLIAFVRIENDAGHDITLGTWGIAGGTFTRPAKQLSFPIESLPAIRHLVAQAQEMLPHAVYDEDGCAVLARSPGAGDEPSDLAIMTARTPSGEMWVGLSRIDGQGTAAVPLDELRTLAKVLADTEEELLRVARPASEQAH